MSGSRFDRLILSATGNPIIGTMSVPGDKSIGHRALFFSACAGFPIEGLPEGEDIQATRRLLTEAGYEIETVGSRVTVREKEVSDNEPLRRSPVRIDCGNSGTTARIGCGFLSGEPGTWVLEGDASLSTRPMQRISDPLARLGVEIQTTDGRLPVTVIATDSFAAEKSEGAGRVQVASAQVHASLILAALRRRQTIGIERTAPMRDHTLRMCRFLDLPIRTRGSLDTVEPTGPTGLRTHATRSDPYVIPGDLSSAAYIAAAATLVPGSSIAIDSVGLNPTRLRFFDALEAMGGKLRTTVKSGSSAPEPFGSMEVSATDRIVGLDRLDRSFDVREFIDEVPLFAIVAACSEGTTTIRGVADLRTKESDRIDSTVSLLRTLGVEVAEHPDGMTVVGRAGRRFPGGVTIDSAGDHRIAMTAGTAAFLADRPIEIRGADVVSVSWPGFWNNGLLQPAWRLGSA